MAKIAVAQVYLLLGAIKEDKNRAKWEVQAEQLKKVRRTITSPQARLKCNCAALRTNTHADLVLISAHTAHR